MQVRAMQDGFYGGEFRAKGSVFKFVGPKLGKWMQPIEGSKPESDAKQAKPKGARSPEDAKPGSGSASDGGKDLI